MNTRSAFMLLVLTLEEMVCLRLSLLLFLRVTADMRTSPLSSSLRRRNSPGRLDGLDWSTVGRLRLGVELRVVSSLEEWLRQSFSM